MLLLRDLHRLCTTPLAALVSIICLSGLCGLPERACGQTTGTWTGGGGLNGGWNNASNWSNGIPLGGATTTLTFGKTTGTTVVNQDFPETFTLNRLTITNVNSGGVSSFTFTGGALRFEGSGAAIILQSPITTTQTINNRLVIGSAGGLTITALSTGGDPLYVINGAITSSQTGNVTLTLSGPSESTSYLNGLISDGSGILGVSKAGSSSYVLTNDNNTFSGNVTISGGTLVVTSVADAGQASALGKGSAVFLGGLNPGTLSFSGAGGSYSTNRNFFLNSNGGSGGVIANDGTDPNSVLTLSGGVISTSAASGLRVLTLSGSNTGANAVYSTLINGNIPLGLTKQGTGLWVIGGNNTFSGGTSIISGALRVTNFAANLGSGNVRLVAGFSTQGVLEASGLLTATVGSGAGQISWGQSGGFAAGVTDLTVRLNNGTPALVWSSGSFVGAGHALQLGSATSQGTVTLENAINLANDARTVYVFNGAADVDAVLTGTVFSSSPASGSLIKAGPGTLRLTADNTYTGFTMIDGTLILGNNGTSGNLAGTVITRSGGILAFNRSDSLTFTSAVTGTGGVRVLSGTVNLSGASTFTGGTTVHAGATLRVRGAGWPTVGDVTVAGGTLTFTDTTARAVERTFVTDGGVINVFNSAVTLTRLDLGDGDLNIQTANASVQTLSLGGGATVTISTGRTLIALTNSYGGPGDLSNTPQIRFNGTGSEGAVIAGLGTLALSGTNVWLQVDDASAAPFDLTIETAITKSGSQGVSKYGAGTLYLPNASPAFKNDLSLINGAVVIGDDRSLGDAEFRFSTNSSRTDLISTSTAALRTDGVAAYTLTNQIVLANLLHYKPLIAGSGDLTLSGAVINTDEGQHLLLSLDAGKTLTVNRLVLSNDTSTKNFTLGGTGFSVIKQIEGGSTATVASNLSFNGTGTVVLTGNNGYRGGTTIHSGTVRVVAGGTITSTFAVQVASVAHFVVDAGGVVNTAVTTTGELLLNGTLTGAVAVNAGGTLAGSGIVGGVLSGAGLVTPGNSPGVLDVAQVDPTAGLDFLFQFSVANEAPSYSNRTASLNDVLHVTGSNPFLAALTSTNGNKITIDFGNLTLHDKDFFLGGFFTNLSGTDFSGMISNADFEFLINGHALETGDWQIGIDTIEQPSVNYGANHGGQVNGRVMRITVHEMQAVPEPSSIILCSLAAGGYLWRRRNQKRRDSATRSAEAPGSTSGT